MPTSSSNFDGARQNFGSTHDGRFFIDPRLLDSVEVLREPASSLYGSGATGGVIEFRTVDAADLLAQGQTAGAAFYRDDQNGVAAAGERDPVFGARVRVIRHPEHGCPIVLPL